MGKFREQIFREQMLKSEYEQIISKVSDCFYCGEKIDISNSIELVVGAYYLGLFESDPMYVERKNVSK